MKKVLLVLLSILSLTCFLTACNENNNEVCSHSYSEWNIVDEATCLEDGLKSHTCSKCGDIETQIIEAFGHTEVVDARVEATCISTGLTEGKHCSVCNKTIVVQEVITKLSHTPVTDVAVEATCSTTGLTEGSHCSVCNTVIVAQQVVMKKDHTIVVDAAVEATCYSTGLTEGKHCSVCTATIVIQKVASKLSHNSSSKITDIPETCFDDGSYYIECTLCHSILERGVLTGGHSYKQTVIPPTSLEKGYTQHKCTRCNDSFIDTYVAALGFDGFAYTVNQDGKTCTIIGLGSVTETEIAIPLTIDGYKVTAIGEQAFADCSHLTKILLQESIKSIGTRAFYGCTGLTEITIPKSVTSIGTQVFYKASNLHTVYYNSSYSSTSNNFLHLSHITKIVFGGEDVPDYILKGSTNVTEVVIQETVKAIGYQSFMECKSITNLTIPKSVTEFGWQSFWIASNIKDVYYLGSIADWLNIDVGSYNSNPLNCGANLYINGELVTEIIVPNTFTKLGYQLCGCTSLEKITIPDTVGIIADDAFKGCTALTSITIPNSVTTIGDAAFYKCSSLAYINYDGTVEEWNIVSKGSSWNTSTGAYVVCCVNGKIAKDGTVTYN